MPLPELLGKLSLMEEMLDGDPVAGSRHQTSVVLSTDGERYWTKSL